MRKSLLFLYFLLLTYALPAQILLTPQVDSIPMRDGKKLAADIHLSSACAQCPTILIQTPYNRTFYRLGLPLQIGKNIDSSKYHVVIVDWRGFWGSLSAFTLNPKRGEDGYDVVEWIAAQSWSNGKIASWGPSALANIQFQTAREQPPHLVCAVPVVGDPQTSYHQYYPGGVLRTEYVEQLDGLGFGVSGLIKANPVYNLLWSITESGSFYPDEIDIPMFMIAGWYDHNLEGMLDFFTALQTQAPVAVRDQHKMVIGPWTHGGNGRTSPGTEQQGELSYPAAAGWNDTLALRFLAHHMLGENNNWPAEPPIRYFQMGQDQWASLNTWPPQGSPSTLYLQADGSMKQSMAAVGSVAVSYDPHDPSPTHGGTTLQLGQKQGPWDQRDTVENRSDILLFDSEVLTQEVSVRGEIEVHLAMASDRKDTDIAVRLMDVYPDGRSMLLTDDILRMRFRDGFRAMDTSLITPGQIYEIQINLPDLAHTFLVGHKIRIGISGSNYPKYDANLNNGGPMYEAGDTLVSQHTLYVGPPHDFRIVLPTQYTLAVEPDRELNGVQVFPNPAKKTLWIEVEEAGIPFQVKIYDLAGKLLSKAKANKQLQLVIQEWPSGLYLVEISQNRRTAHRKILIK